MDLLSGESVIELSGNEFLPVEGKSFIQQVLEHFASQGGQANSPFGIVILDKKGIKNDMSHGIGREKAASFAAIKDVLENGIVIQPMKQYFTNNKKNPTGMIAAPITIGDEKFVCVVVVIGNRNLNRLYVHEVTLTKNLQVDVADTNAVHGDDNHLVTHPQGEITKVLKNHLISKQNNQNPQQSKLGDSLEPRYNIIKENNQINCNKNMNRNSKNVVRLMESELRDIIKESVNTCLNEMHLDRNYTDEKGNKISGKKALKQQGENMWGVDKYTLNNNQAIYNQAKHLQVVLREFTRNLLRNPYNRNKPIIPAPNGQVIYQDEIIDLAQRLESALENALQTPHYGDHYDSSDYD